jgi:hypothetical protein
MMHSMFQSSKFRLLGILSALAAACLFSACNETTSPPASTGRITFTSPVKGSAWKVGDSLRVKWITKDDPDDSFTSVQILLSVDDGKTYYQLIDHSVKNPGDEWEKVAWFITDSLAVTGGKIKVAGCTTCRVKVKEYGSSDAAKTAVTEIFTINP